MSATARGKIETIYFNHPQFTSARRFFAQRQSGRLLSTDLSNLNGTTLPDNLVGKIDCLFNFFIARIIERHVDFAFVLEHPKTMRRRVKQFDEGLRQNMLTGVLLHVVQPPHTIDSSMNRVTDFRNRPLDNVQHAFIFGIDAINYTGVSKRPQISGLATSGWVKCSAVEGYCDLPIFALVDTQDPSVKFQQT